jgi:hypothetical protein
LEVPLRKFRALLAAAAVVVSSSVIAAPAQAWECQKNELCHGTLMTVCMTVGHVKGEYNCH